MVGAMTILFSMFRFINLPLTGIAQGSQPIVSFNYGAKEYGRVKQTLGYAIVACTAFSLCGTTLMVLFPSFFIRLFNRDPELVNLGSRMLRVYISGCFFIGANSLYQQTDTSMGEGKMSFFFAFFRKVILLLQCTKDYNKNGLPTYNFYRSSKERYFIFLKCNDYMLQLRAKLARRLIS